MKTDFNLAEIFEIAVRIEQNGAAFYRRAAETQVCAGVKEFLMDLAEQEAAHEGLFAGIRRHFENRTDTPEMNDEMTLLYLKAVAGNFVFKRNTDNEFLSFSGWTINDIFNMAMDREKDSIMFYLGVKELMEDSEDRRIIDYLIHEEQRHFAVLNFNLEKLRGGDGK